MRALAGILLACAVALGALAAPGTAAAPQDDFAAVYRDWEPDRAITPCRFSEQQLENALAIASSDPDLAYTGFPNAIERELARWRGGGCRAAVRDASPLAAVSIAGVRGAGGASRERVTLRNRGRSAVRLDGARLRNARGRSVRLPRGARIGAGRTLTVTVGCVRGQRRAGARGTRAWACSRRELLADRGDVVRLLDRAGTVVSQRGFGRERRTPSF